MIDKNKLDIFFNTCRKKDLFGGRLFVPIAALPKKAKINARILNRAALSASFPFEVFIFLKRTFIQNPVIDIGNYFSQLPAILDRKEIADIFGLSHSSVMMLLKQWNLRGFRVKGERPLYYLKEDILDAIFDESQE